MANGPLSNLVHLVDGVSRRISSYDRTGGNQDWATIPVGETLTLADIQGAGIVQHLWVTIWSDDPMHRRNLVLRMYWDGQEHPSVESPIGDFFGQGWGMEYNFASLPLAAAPREGKALVCYFPMPFSNGARITVENQGTHDAKSFYYYLDYEQRPSVPESMARFHAWYNQELTHPESEVGDREGEWGMHGVRSLNTDGRRNYLFCECEGRGHFVGVNYYVHSPTPLWYGEGDDLFLVDGEAWPGSAHGTGTEDYFNTAWGPDERFLHPYFGIARAPGRLNDDPRLGWIGKTHCYRFHLEDPIRFKRSLVASIEHGHSNCLTLEMSSVAYWYQTLPSKPFPPLAPASERKPRPEVDMVAIHRWRDAWRRLKGGGPLWGDEPD